jgi:hypothetical protein
MWLHVKPWQQSWACAAMLAANNAARAPKDGYTTSGVSGVSIGQLSTRLSTAARSKNFHQNHIAPQQTPPQRLQFQPLDSAKQCQGKAELSSGGWASA